jgi:hypothetical protein
MNYFYKFWAGIGFSLTLSGIFWLPKDLSDWKQAADPWQKMFVMIDQNTALWAFSLCALAYIFWIDLRPLIKGKLLINRFEKFLADYESEKPSFHSATKNSYLIESELHEKKFAARFDREILPLISKRRISVQEYKIAQRRWREVYNTVINSQS